MSEGNRYAQPFLPQQDTYEGHSRREGAMKRTIPMYERVLAGKTMNASVEERPAYRIATTRKPESCEPRFGSRMASYLLVIE